MNNIGEVYALITAFFWMATSLSFEVATKKFGSLTVNLLRLSLAFVFLSVFGLIARGKIFPIDASLHNWIWLGLSAVVGFIIGDFLLFKGFATIGARVSQSIMALSPTFAAIFGFIILNDKMTLQEVLGMIITISGIMLVLISKNNNPEKSQKLNIKYPLKGVLFALGGAIGQGIGLVISKYGMQDYNAFASAQIRVLVGATGFATIFLLQNKWFLIKETTKYKKESIILVIGTIFGPFLGVSFSLLAVQNTNPGVAQTLMSIVPIIIIPFSHFVMKEKIKLREIIGAFLAFLGVSMFFVQF